MKFLLDTQMMIRLHRLTNFRSVGRVSYRCFLSTESKPKSAASSTSSSSTIVYEGPFAGMLKRLRRVSIVSTTVAFVGFPLTMVFGIPSASISLAGQLGVVGTSLLASASSTFFLQLITHPYVTELREIKQEGVEVSGDQKDRQFLVSRLNYFGNTVQTQFNLSQVTKGVGKAHPYASCQADGQHLYLHGSELKDTSLRILMTNDSSTHADSTAAVPSK